MSAAAREIIGSDVHRKEYDNDRHDPAQQLDGGGYNRCAIEQPPRTSRRACACGRRWRRRASRRRALSAGHRLLDLPCAQQLHLLLRLPLAFPMRALLLLLTPQLIGHVKRRIERLVFTWGEKMLKRPKLKELTDLQANIKAR
ncbi:hypothetical protein PF006_g6687 [Phytophthora fragariae]|uniref:Uncharacterized protein n=1 Tax=Phytophthora fragariae TaxID=53985 RepID=A0A6A3MBC2_9STRA|nr:hypothetical protein PF011_g1071 [Phytophthora fragariae]KAE9148757.1 hypothetical protein PF006_g6687 [Phytophthora fragariae]